MTKFPLGMINQFFAIVYLSNLNIAGERKSDICTVANIVFVAFAITVFNGSRLIRNNKIQYNNCLPCTNT